MFTRKGWILSVLVLGVVIVMSAGVARAIGIGGPIEPPPAPALDPCNDQSDKGKIGAVPGTLAEDVSVPIYIGTAVGKDVGAFFFRFTVPAGLVPKAPTGGLWGGQYFDMTAGQPYAWDAANHILTVSYTGSTSGTPASPITPDFTQPFINLNFSTCGSVPYVYTSPQPIVWYQGTTGSPQPENWLGVTGCYTDPITTMIDGSVSISPVRVQFSISTETALLGDNVTVTVSCVNDYDFWKFSHTLQWDNELLVLDQIDPISPSVQRTATTLTVTPSAGQLTVSGENALGYGTSAVAGEAFYKLKFKVRSKPSDARHDNRKCDIWFKNFPQVTALKCNLRLDQLYNIVRTTNGWVQVPAYLATVKFGTAEWSIDNSVDSWLRVPFYIETNYPIAFGQFEVKYKLASTHPLECKAVEITYPNPLMTSSFYNSRAANDGSYYAEFQIQGLIERTNGSSVQLGWLYFRNSSAPADIRTYNLELGNVSQFGNLPPVRSVMVTPAWDNGDGNQTTLDIYYMDTPERLAYTPGTINLQASQVTYWIPAAEGVCRKIGGPIPTCESSAGTDLYVNTNRDLDSIWFTLNWDNTKFCVSVSTTLPADRVFIKPLASGGTYVRVKDIGAALPANANPVQCFAHISVGNKTTANQSGTFTLSQTGARSASHVDCPYTATAGGISLGGASASSMTICDAALASDVSAQKPSTVPERFDLIQNYPNPFNASTMINFDLAEPGQTTLQIFNVMGQLVATPFDANTEAGRYSIRWDARDDHGQPVASGVYLYRLQSGALTATKKMILLK